MLMPIIFDSITALTEYNYIILTDTFNEQKEKVQKLLYDKLGVKIDLCLQGHGTTNTDNIARKCFSQPELFANCLDLDENFVSNIANILIIFKSKKMLIWINWRNFVSILISSTTTYTSGLEWIRLPTKY